MATAKKPKNQILYLDNTSVEAEFFEDVQMMCLICPHEPYHLVWHINRTLPFPFTRKPEQDIAIGEDYYVVYEFLDEINQISHYLIASRAKTRHILPELKNIDFIWMMKGGHLVDRYIKDLPNVLKKIPGIVDCRPINHQILSQRQVFLL